MGTVIKFRHAGISKRGSGKAGKIQLQIKKESLRSMRTTLGRGLQINRRASRIQGIWVTLLCIAVHCVCVWEEEVGWVDRSLDRSESDKRKGWQPAAAAETPFILFMRPHGQQLLLPTCEPRRRRRDIFICSVQISYHPPPIVVPQCHAQRGAYLSTLETRQKIAPHQQHPTTTLHSFILHRKIPARDIVPANTLVTRYVC